MTQEISSLMDGELEAHEAERAIRGCCASSEAAQKWQEYHLIGDVLRGGRPHPSGTAERVREALEDEPAIVARPRRIARPPSGASRSRRPPRWPRSAWWAGSAARRPGGPGGVVAKSPAAVQPVAHKPRRRPWPRPPRTSRTTSSPIARSPRPTSIGRYEPGTRRPARLDEGRGVAGRRRILPALALGIACARPGRRQRPAGLAQRAAQAARQVTYEGVYVHTNGERTSTVRITHVIHAARSTSASSRSTAPRRDRAPQRRDVLPLPRREDGAARPAHHHALLPRDPGARRRSPSPRATT